MGGLALAGASVASGLIGSQAAGRAANAQVNAEQDALNWQRKVYGDLNQNYAPYMNVGRGALYSLGQMYGIGQDGKPTGQGNDFSQFTNSPDYQFAQQQGELGLQRYENANGMALSGGALKDAAQFNQGLATQQFGNYFNRLMGLSQLGAQATSSLGGNAVGMSNQIGNTIGQIGQSQASGIIGSANALSGGINNGITNSLLYNSINRSSYANPSGGGNGFSFGNLGGTGGGLGGLF